MKAQKAHNVATEEPDVIVQVHMCAINNEMEVYLGIVPSGNKARYDFAIRQPSYSSVIFSSTHSSTFITFIHRNVRPTPPHAPRSGVHRTRHPP
jgi:hypothetical protein